MSEIKKCPRFNTVISSLLVFALTLNSVWIGASALSVNRSELLSDSVINNEYKDEYEVYSGTHSVDVGRAGTFTIDDYSLDTELSLGSFGIEQNVFPVWISMRYASREYDFLDNIGGISCDSFGSGWLTNFNSFIAEVNYTDATELLYFDGTGSAVRFGSTEALTSEEAQQYPNTVKWISDHSGLILYANTNYNIPGNDGSLPPRYLIAEPDGKYLLFDTQGRLAAENDAASGNGTVIEYLTDNDAPFDSISKITDGVGNEYRFTYSGGKVTKLKAYDPSGNAVIAGDGTAAAALELTFTYTGTKLTGITFPDGKTVCYTYDNDGNLTSATNIDGYKVEIAYTSGGVPSLISGFAFDEGEETYIAGGTLSISAPSDDVRVFTDNYGHSQIKTFDSVGNIISIVDENGAYLYGEPPEEATTEEGTTEYTAPEEEGTTEYYDWEEEEGTTYVRTCPCSDCPEPQCSCDCVSENDCTCPQCKRREYTITDNNGNVSEAGSFDGDKYLRSLNTHTQDGAHLARSIDTRGNTVYYVYDAAGFLKSLSQGNKTLNYNYDSMGDLTALFQQVSGLVGGTQMKTEYSYENDRISSVSHNGFSYDFEYDIWGNQTTVKIGSTAIASCSYGTGENSSRLSQISFANGQSIGYTYDSDNNITAVTYDGSAVPRYTYSYDENGVLTSSSDNETGLTTTYSDDGAVEIRDAENTVIYSYGPSYDGYVEDCFGRSLEYTESRLYDMITGISSAVRSVEYEFTSKNGENVETNYTADLTFTCSSDWFGRYTGTDVDWTVTDGTIDVVKQLTREYSFADTATVASSSVASMTETYTDPDGVSECTDNYEYDDKGNLTGVYRNISGVKTYYHTYVYDEADQLVRENDLINSRTIVYTYDVGGNIMTKTFYEYTLGDITSAMTPTETNTFAYGNTVWKDVLTSYNGQAVTYDANGNITGFAGKTFTWTAGRQLKSSTAGDVTDYYDYNEDGYISRYTEYKNNELDHYCDYLWRDGKLMGVNLVDSDGEGKTAQILYDENESPVGYLYDGKTLGLYRKDLQGDIIGSYLFSGSGEYVNLYTYDAYGEMTVINRDLTNGDPNSVSWLLNVFDALMFFAQPLMYRGYVGVPIGDSYCYYLGTRFYCPELGRFLNCDSYADTGTGVVGANAFAYCNNNPVMFVDPEGTSRQFAAFANMARKVIKIVKAVCNLLVALSDNTTKKSWPTGERHIVDDYPYYNGGGSHHGTDIPGGNGDSVFAAMSGYVIDIVDRYKNEEHYNPYTGVGPSYMSSGTPSWGNYIRIKLDSDNSVELIYAHLKDVSVSVNQHVASGQLIGHIGLTGCTTGYHLHFAARKNGDYVNPSTYLPSV